MLSPTNRSILNTIDRQTLDQRSSKLLPYVSSEFVEYIVKWRFSQHLIVRIKVDEQVMRWMKLQLKDILSKYDFYHYRQCYCILYQEFSSPKNCLKLLKRGLHLLRSIQEVRILVLWFVVEQLWWNSAVCVWKMRMVEWNLDFVRFVFCSGDKYWWPLIIWVLPINSWSFYSCWPKLVKLRTYNHATPEKLSYCLNNAIKG